ncbi:MAG: ATP-binding protein [Ignavibacteria bacterium]|nr:ATP-binding protein [Ignavibacteria bacterium]
MDDISLHILDIAENGINAGAENIFIEIIESTKDDLLNIKIKDDGKGMTEETIKKITDPFVTTRTTRKVGLGIPLIKLAAEMTGGGLGITSKEGEGTEVNIKFKLSHIDRQPLGNMIDTVLAIFANESKINLKYFHKKDNREFEFESDELKEISKNLGISNGILIPFMKKYLINNYNNFKSKKEYDSRSDYKNEKNSLEVGK